MLTEMAAENQDICLITGDLGFGVFTNFKERFPYQYINAGVAEQNMLGIATGLALTGKTIFAYSIGNFPTLRCLEQIRNDACYHDANVKIVTVGGGFSYGSLGISHHATEDISIMRSLPNITVVCPGDRWEAARATAALAQLPGTCYLRLDKSYAPDTNESNEVFNVGKARKIVEGSDATLIATGGILSEALIAAEELRNREIKCRVISMHTIKPLDEAALHAACHETAGIITIEENTIDGGLGSAVAETCLENGERPGFFHRIGLRAGFSCIVGSQAYLRKQYGMDAASIASTVETHLSNHSRMEVMN